MDKYAQALRDNTEAQKKYREERAMKESARDEALIRKLTPSVLGVLTAIKARNEISATVGEIGFVIEKADGAWKGDKNSFYKAIRKVCELFQISITTTDPKVTYQIPDELPVIDEDDCSVIRVAYYKPEVYEHPDPDYELLED